jgi:hypothetical protein
MSAGEKWMLRICLLAFVALWLVLAGGHISRGG